MSNQTQNISDERLAEKLRNAEIAEAAYVKSGLNPQAELWREDVSLLRELTALRASHKRLVEALESYPAYPNSCMHNEEPDYCDGCLYQYEKAVCVWQEQRSAALADARKLEGK